MQDYLERGKKKRESNNKFTIISFFQLSSTFANTEIFIYVNSNEYNSFHLFSTLPNHAYYQEKKKSKF